MDLQKLVSEALDREDPNYEYTDYDQEENAVEYSRPDWDEAARIALDAIPDGCTKLNGQWVRVAETGGVNDAGDAWVWDYHLWFPKGRYNDLPLYRIVEPAPTIDSPGPTP